MQISFHGACQQVTGSNVLIDSGGKKIILDCGIFQGVKLSEEKNYGPFGYEPKEINAVIICHAHLDHVGRLPKLIKEGFGGPIYATEPTRELTKIVLEDSEKLMKEEADRDRHAPLFNKEHVSQTISLFKPIPYEDRFEVEEGIYLTFKNAGHILGSAIALVEAEGKKLIYTSDLGNIPAVLLDPPTHIPNADVLITESTYGGRVHEDVALRVKKLSEVISQTVAKNGVLLIPSFAIERTQELLHDIDHFCTTSGCEKPTFYLDSPMAQKVTQVFRKFPKYLGKKIRSEHLDNDFFGLERINFTETVEDSKSINDAKSPKVIIAGSGMMNGGRILHHLKRYIGDSNNTLLIVGYQAQGTLGRKIFDGEKEIKIFGEPYHVRANIKAVGSYSAHADSPQLTSYAKAINSLKQVFIVHGEEEEAGALSQSIGEATGVQCNIAEQGKIYEI